MKWGGKECVGWEQMGQGWVECIEVWWIEIGRGWVILDSVDWSGLWLGRAGLDELDICLISVQIVLVMFGFVLVL